MTPLSLESVLAGTGAILRGQLPDETTFNKIERDARQAEPGDLILRFGASVSMVTTSSPMPPPMAPSPR